MVSAKEESEVIKLLLNLEKEASLVVDEALVEADKRITEAKTSANAEFQKKYEKLIKEMEEDYSKKVIEIESNHEKIVEEYKLSLESKNQNKQAFFTFVDSVFFKAVTN